MEKAKGYEYVPKALCSVGLLKKKNTVGLFNILDLIFMYYLLLIKHWPVILFPAALILGVVFGITGAILIIVIVVLAMQSK